MIENHITVIESENQIELNLKMNGRLLQINLYISLFSTLFLSLSFIYLIFPIDITNKDNLITLLISMVILPYLNYEYLRNRKWVKNATEHFIFTENKLTITKSIFNKTLLSQDINLNDIREIQYSAWSSISFPYLPYKTHGNIHIQTPSKTYSVAINLNKEESEAFIDQLLYIISRFDKSGHFIFVKHLHLK